MPPDRRPQDEGHTRQAGAGVGGGQGHAPRQAGHDGAEAPGGGEPQDRALGRADDGEREVAAARAAAVAHPPADEGEDHVLAGVHTGEGADAKARRMVGDEEDRPRIGHARSASA
jgi:hypothetical protein